MEDQQFMTSGQVARLLGVSESTVQRWEREGRLTALRHPTSNRRLFRAEAVQQFRRQLRAQLTGWPVVPAPETPDTSPRFATCPDCGAQTLAHEEGCSKCYSCGFAAC
jgi:excisionase family DNA binding protein